MVKWLSIFLLFGTSLFAEESSCSIAANKVGYDGICLHLKENVQLKDEFGAVSCDEAQVFFDINKQTHDVLNKDTRIIYLLGNVYMKLSDGSELVADEGMIQCDKLEGYFICYAPRKVNYKTIVQQQNRKKTARVRSQTMEVRLKRDEQGKLLLSDFKGDQIVQIEYEPVR